MVANHFRGSTVVDREADPDSAQVYVMWRGSSIVYLERFADWRALVAEAAWVSRGSMA